jgi:5-(aminomethyl)-3-furanmethanol phosphate kinase
VKLGGSLARSHSLARWVEALAVHGAGRVVIVPGGGAFADAVRRVDRRWRLPAPVAHRMALLAMEQYGCLLAALHPTLRSGETETGLRAVLRAGGVAVWSPARMAARSVDIEQSWEGTSDSLAAWLAARLGASDLVLVKSVAPPAGAVAVAELERRGIVDPRFAHYAAAPLRTWWAGARRSAAAARALAGRGRPGAPVVLLHGGERPWPERKSTPTASPRSRSG